MFNKPDYDSIFSDDTGLPQIHDHFCALYDSTEEWKSFTGLYIKLGLEQGERCIYIFDTHSAKQVREALRSEGIDTAAAESSGQLIIIHGHKVYTCDEVFDPKNLIEYIVREIQKATAEGFPALRVTTEMEWLLDQTADQKKFVEYSIKLNRDLIPHYPCLLVCQYDINKYTPEVMNNVFLTHSKVMRGIRTINNLYYISPEKLREGKNGEIEIRQRLEFLEREDKKEKQARNRARTLQVLLDESRAIILVLNQEGQFIDANRATLDFLEVSHEDLIGKPIRSFSVQENIGGENRVKNDISSVHNSEMKFLVNGKVKTVLLNMIPVIQDGQRVIYGIGQDISHLKQSGRLLVKRN